MRIGGVYVSIDADTGKLKVGFKSAERLTKKTASRMNKTIGTISFAKVGVAAAAFSATIAILGKKVIETGREFETTMKTVQAWSGATGIEFKALEKKALEMGASTEWSANQSAEALKFLSAAGFTAQQSIAALPGTLELATAGQTDLARATDIVTDTLTAYGMGVEELQRVSDAFITTTSSTNTNVSMLGESFKMVAPTAKIMGQEIEQTAGMLGILANAGVKGTMAGSGLNMVLLKSIAAAKKLGIEGASLTEVLKKMKEEQWDATQIAEVFGARNVKTAGILMDNIDAFEQLTEKIKDNKGATSDLADIIRDSLDNDLKILNSTIEGESLRVFGEYKDEIREIIQATTDWIQENQDVIDALAKVGKMMIDVAVGTGKLINSSIEFSRVWVTTWKALGLAAGGVTTYMEALTNGVEVVSKFDTEIGNLELQVAKLNRQISGEKDIIELAERFGETNTKAIELKESLEKQRESLNNQISALKLAKDELENVTTASSGLTEENKKLAKSNKEVAKTAEEIISSPLENYYFGIIGRVEELEAAQEAASKLALEYLDDQADATITAYEGMYTVADVSLHDTTERHKEASAAATKLWEDFVSNTGDGMKSLVDDVFTGEIHNINQLFEGLWTTAYEMFLDFVSKITTNTLLEWLFPDSTSGMELFSWGDLFGGSPGKSPAGAATGAVGSVATAAVGKSIADSLGITAITDSIKAGVASWFGGAGAGMSVLETSLTEGTQLALLNGEFGPAALGGTEAIGAGAGSLGGLAGAAGLFGMGLAGSSLFKDTETMSEAMARMNDEVVGLSDSLSLTSDTIGFATRASYDASTGLAFLETGFNDLNNQTQYSIQQFDALTGTWIDTGLSVDNLTAQMQAYITTTGASADAAAKYVATAAGVPTLIDELTDAFGQLGSGAMSAAAQISQAQSVISSINPYYVAGVSSEENTSNYNSPSTSEIAAAQNTLNRYGSGNKNYLGSFDVGSDYIPKDGLAYLHRGEKVVPAAQNKRDEIGAVKQNINVQVFVGNEELKGQIRVVSDEVHTAKTKAGETGRVYF